ncbi:MAG: serine hydrolase domain-containing protein [Vagococcus sp.]|uniref:serine hydrolase domain-containing protein n=1 Tax=Vagococcus sp. TaxID=1933889 RepID=UPI002FC6DA2A
MYSKTESFIKQLVDERKIPGISYAFLSKSKQYKKVIGLKQITPFEERLLEDTLYDMASLTKVICTNSVILKLIEKNKLSIDTPLNSYLPEFTDKLVTIRQLLTHTSGINPYIPNRDSLNQEELKREILKLTSNDSRGKIVKYTDTGTVLLGFLIEEIYQKSVHDVFLQEVIHPLKMERSFFYNFDKKEAAPTEYSSKRGLIQGDVHDPKAYVLKDHCGSAGLFSTLEDTILFVQMMMNGGKTVDKATFLSQKTVMSLCQDYTDGNMKKRSLGWDLIEKNKHTFLYHTGYTGTFILMDIKEQEGLIFLSNRVHPHDNREEYILLRDQLIEIYLNETTNH